MSKTSLYASTLSARNQMAFQERMANTAHQREVEDLRAAGLNPVLSSGGSGAAVPSGAAGDYSINGELLKLAHSAVDSTSRSAKAMANLINKKPIIYNSPSAPSAAAQLIPTNSAPGIWNLLYATDGLKFKNAKTAPQIAWNATVDLLTGLYKNNPLISWEHANQAKLPTYSGTDAMLRDAGGGIKKQRQSSPDHSGAVETNLVSAIGRGIASAFSRLGSGIARSARTVVRNNTNQAARNIRLAPSTHRRTGAQEY